MREDYVGHEDAFETDFTRQDAIVLNLQRACEAAIDMTNRLIKLLRLRYPKDSKESFRIMAEAGVLDPGDRRDDGADGRVPEYCRP